MLITNRSGSFYEALNKAFVGAREVSIATAYITPGACEQIRLLSRARSGLLQVSVGRALEEGLPLATKSYLLRLHKAAQSNGGGVRLDVQGGFHSKLYSGGGSAFVGSSNLTEHGISGWREANGVLIGSDTSEIVTELRRLYDGGADIDCVYDEIPVPARRFDTSRAGSQTRVLLPAEPGSATPGISISLLDQSGDVPAKSGLNWGLALGRPRDRYECYIRFPVNMHEDGAYTFGSTDKGTRFIAHTHDGKTLEMRLEGNSRAGEATAKQISTEGDKSALGKWMVLDCLGITDGRQVVRKDLDQYGRTTVELYRTGTMPDGRAIVYMDFSKA